MTGELFKEAIFKYMADFIIKEMVSAAVALAYSINIGSAVYDTTQAKCTSNMPLNCLIFQDHIAKINRTMDKARKGAMEIREMLDSQQLMANADKSKFVLIRDLKS